MQDLEGYTLNINAAAVVVSGAVSFDPKTYDVVGGNLGLGLLPPMVPAGGSVSATYTEVWSLGGAFTSLFEWGFD